jgi:queuosine precursor transporter
MKSFGYLAFACYLGSIPLANWMIGHVGFCADGAPCVLPVAPLPAGHALMAPSGVLMAGFALVLRDVVQRCLGLAWGLAAVFVGAALSALVAPPALVLASGAGFLLSELADFAVYTPLQKRGLVLAVIASCALGLVMDSIVFLGLAFGSLAFLPGQIVGKAWAVLVSLPVIRYLRRVTPSPA